MHAHPADPDEFQRRAGPLLRRAEVAHTLVLSAAAVADGRRWLVEEGGEVVAAGARAADFRLALSVDAPPGAMRALAKELLGSGDALPGVVGRAEEVLPFLEVFTHEGGRKALRAMAMRLFQLEVLRPPRPVSGAARLVTDADLPVAERLTRAFTEALGEDATHAERMAKASVRARRLVLWEDPQPVACTGSTPTGRGVRVNRVYTPPEHRRRGYASACVADVSQRCLDAGSAYCCLFTDLANPTSNHIYQELGYRPVCDFEAYALR